MKDIKNVKLTINGFAHTYEYEHRFKNAGEYGGEGFNVGVKFGNKYGEMTYSRAIYKSDIDYRTEDTNKELKVYITYEIAIKNQTKLTTRANKIVDYYDSRYTLKSVGENINERAEVEETDSIEWTEREERYNNKYNMTTITLNDFIEGEETKKIYIQYELKQEAKEAIMTGIDMLQNVAEIKSYSVIDEQNKAYAGIDVDSVPGNAIPEDKTSYEDDTDAAPGLQLEIANERTMKGIVFLDNTTNELQTGVIREADGEYKEAEDTPIEGVEVSLKEENGEAVKTKTVEKDGIYGFKFNTGSREWTYEEVENLNPDREYTVKAELKKGEFLIPGYIPGRYTLTYKWGNEEYNVQDYKGTIYKDKDRQESDIWYKTETPRYSDAIDNWDTRKQIDKEIEEENQTITTMSSNTPEMKIGIECYEPYKEEADGLNYNVHSEDNGDKIEAYEIKNVDFGIVERARQEIKLDKNVKTMKITLPNGQTIADARINEEGQLEGQIDDVTGGPSYGFIKAEIDDELKQGATLEIGYNMKAKNISEIEYLSEDYYKYGYKQAQEANKLGEILKLNVEKLEDYLDSTLTLKEESKDWKLDSENETSTKILLTKELDEEYLEPNESITNEITMEVSKIISNKDNNVYNNKVRIAKVSRTEIQPENPYGRRPKLPEDSAEEVRIMSPTGKNLNYTLPIIIGISALSILGIGIFIIRKKLIKE